GTRLSVGLPLLLISTAAVLPRSVVAAAPGRSAGGARATTLIAAFVLLTIYGVATARETCGDLIYFWGPKGQQFHYAGSIDAGFLGAGDYVLMHSDYPPLLPLLYAWASLIAHRF